MIHRDMRQHDRALTEFEEALPIYEAHLAEDDPERVKLVGAYAYILRTVERKEEAEALYRQSIAEMRRNPEAYPEHLPGDLNNLGYLLRLKGEYAEAEELYREAITSIETHWGEAHPRTLMYRNNLASVLQKQGRGEEAAEQLAQNITLEEGLHGETHWRVGRSHRSLGICRYQIADYAVAAEDFARSRAIFAQALGEDHLWTATSGVCEALARHGAGQAGEAERIWKSAEVILETPDARVDGNVQGILKLMRTWLPAGDPWSTRLDALIAREG
jgi:tetratricopeptide (TPR) repeat protein